MKTVLLLIGLIAASIPPADAQQPKVYRVGVLLPGGTWYETVDGLRVGLRELGFEQGKHFTLVIRDTKGDAKAADAAARNLEGEKINLIYTTASSVTIAARRATAGTPIVFCAGTDPVVLGLVDSFAKPGGRLTGVHYRDSDLTAKRLEILKEMVPKLSRVVTFYVPHDPVAVESSRLAREAAQRFGLQFIEQHVASIEELRVGVRALRSGGVDAIFQVQDALVNSQNQLIIDTARLNRLPTMFVQQNPVTKGGLASYAVSFHEVGRLSAKYVQRVLAGANPQDLPVEGVDKIELVVNLQTAKQIGLTIPPQVLARADRVIK